LRKLTYTSRREPDGYSLTHFSIRLDATPKMHFSFASALKRMNMSTDYNWRESYQAAIVEIDDTKLRERLQAAKAAIDTRLHEL
jgi:hypothetical protein